MEDIQWACQELLSEQGVPPRFVKARLESYNLEYRRPHKSLFITGKAGRGKTHFMAALMQYNIIEALSDVPKINSMSYESIKEILIKKGIKQKFVKTTQILREIRNTYESGSLVKDIEVIYKYTKELDYLFLDDMGVERITEWGLQIFYEIIDTIYSDNRMNLIVSSNLSLDELSRKIDDRITSRLFEMCEVLHFSGPDRRINLC